MHDLALEKWTAVSLQRTTASRQTPGARFAPPLIHEVIASAGHPLDLAARRAAEARLGYDFSRVRIHSDARAGASADSVGAPAFTVGEHVVVHPNEYRPATSDGRQLLTHELVHVIQQRHAPRAIERPIPIGPATDPAEDEANLAAQAAGQAYRNSRAAAMPASSYSSPVLQRQLKKLPTWAGQFLLNEYAPQVGEDNPDVNGATITMHFQPNDLVEAREIAFIQTARGIVDGKPRTMDYGNELSQKVAESRNIPKGETGQGTHIDQRPYNRTPVGAMKSAGGNTLAGPTPNLEYTDIGFHFHDTDGSLKTKNPMFHDTPNLTTPRDIQQEQEFETAAVALKGKQEGVYYGSVEWGWYKYPSQNIPKLKEFKVRSKDAPSGVFQRAGQMWNVSTTTEGKPSIQVPGMDMSRIRTATILFEGPGGGKKLGQLSKDVRVGQTDLRTPGSRSQWINVVIVDGALAGKRGWVAGADLGRS